MWRVRCAASRQSKGVRSRRRGAPGCSHMHMVMLRLLLEFFRSPPVSPAAPAPASSSWLAGVPAHLLHRPSCTHKSHVQLWVWYRARPSAHALLAALLLTVRVGLFKPPDFGQAPCLAVVQRHLHADDLAAPACKARPPDRQQPSATGGTGREAQAAALRLLHAHRSCDTDQRHHEFTRSHPALRCHPSSSPIQHMHRPLAPRTSGVPPGRQVRFCTAQHCTATRPFALTFTQPPTHTYTYTYTLKHTLRPSVRAAAV